VNNNNPTTYNPTAEEGVKCDGCGIVCDAVDAVTDDFIALCGSVYGNGCADMPGAFEYA
jgi:hypothetical protein